MLLLGLVLGVALGWLSAPVIAAMVVLGEVRRDDGTESEEGDHG